MNVNKNFFHVSTFCGCGFVYIYTTSGRFGEAPEKVYTVKGSFTIDALGGGQLKLILLVGASRHYTTRVKNLLRSSCVVHRRQQKGETL